MSDDAKPSRRGIVVTGDVTMDWNLAQQPLGANSERGGETRASWQRGGAALLTDLVEAVVEKLDPENRPVFVHTPDAPHDPIAPGEHAWNHSYALWAQVKEQVDSREGNLAWRVETFLGVDRSRGHEKVDAEWERLFQSLPDADVIALDDGGLGFRERSDLERWGRTTAGANSPWVVLKASRPVAEGDLFEHLLATCPDRLIAIIKIDDLRGSEVQVSRELSWERTAQDLFRELLHNPKVNALAQIAHTVVSFGPAGAALVSGPAGGSDRPTCSLFYDPDVIEGMWEAKHPGQMMGSTDCVVAAVLREIFVRFENPRIDRGIQAGVAAQRRFHLAGYEEWGPGRMQLGFPHSLVASEIAAGGEPLQEIEVPDPSDSTAGEYWTILRHRLQNRRTNDLTRAAAKVAEKGPEAALPGVPLGRFGKLVTADRSEIEAFRSIWAVVAEYRKTRQSKPLSIAVFGPPGSGKSFGIVEVVRSVDPARVSEPLEFNLSQFGSSDELSDALHRVRDERLGGKIPLVFWDEFDASLQGERLGWLRHFLAPMQDGEFRQGQITHPIGACVFVFAGGTCERMDHFDPGPGRGESEFRNAKGPDFVSRLKGYVNILGPNPRAQDDPYHVVRRAILLRSILLKLAPQFFKSEALHVDPGVLRAFLETEHYRHGARSLEAIVAMSLLSGRTAYERSSLPAEPQLDLHVDGRDFLSLVQAGGLAAKP